jgi:hypothetical protein
MENIIVFDVKWTFKDKYLQQLCHLEPLKIIYEESFNALHYLNLHLIMVYFILFILTLL